MPLSPGGHAFGRLPQTPDPRDRVLAPTPGAILPPAVDLRTSPYRPPIWNQGHLGACTSFASARIAEQTYGVDGWANPFEPSHLFLYFNARDLEGTTLTDSGAQMRDAMKALATAGMCAESYWPYVDTDPGPFSQRPPQPAYDNAATHLATSYQAVPLDLASMKACLAAGYPYMVGIEVYASFEGPGPASTGIVPLPDQTNEQHLGGHAVTVQGYDDAKEWFILDNSWGPKWGDQGSFYLPYGYLTNPLLASDAWTIRTQL